MDRPNSPTTGQAPWQETSLAPSVRYRRSPFFDATRRHGCEAYGVYNHMLFPADYGDPIGEYRDLLERVVLWEVGVQRIVEIRGPDAMEFTDTLTPRDLRACETGQGKYAPLTAGDGGIVNDPVLLRLAEDRFWLSLADSDAGLWVRGLAHDSAYDVEITHPDVHPVQVQGPRSKDVVDDLFGPEIRDLRYYRCAETRLDDIPVVVSRTGWSGEVGYEIYLRDAGRADETWEAIMDAGEPYEIRPCPPSEIRRIEAGIFSYGADVTIDDTPLEVSGMERLVELDRDADFVGRAALERLAAEGVDRKLVGVEIADDVGIGIAAPWAAFHDGEQVGQVTAATWSPRLDRSIGYVWVPIELAEPGTDLRLETAGGETHAGTTATLPFVDPDKTTPKG